MHKKSISVLLMIILAGCVAGPDYQNFDPYETTQIANALKLTGKNLSISSDWYKEFDEKNLDILIEEGLSSSTDVLGALERLRQARTNAKIAGASFLPVLSSKGQYNFAKASKNIGPAADTNYFETGFDASWELDLWGSGQRKRLETKALFESAFYSLQNVKAILTAEISKTYFMLKTVDEKLKIARNNLALQKDIYLTVKNKFDAGIADETAYYQAKYAVATTKASIPELEAQKETYKNALAVLVGKLPQTLPDDLCKSKNNKNEQAYQYDISKLYDLPADIIRTRPDVRVAERTLAAQNEEIGQAVAALYPNVSISALLGLEAGSGSKLLNRDSRAYGYAPVVNLPIFNWGMLQNKVNLEREKTAESYQNYRKVVLQAVKELADAQIQLKEEYKTNASRRVAVASMQKVLKAMKLKYDNGLIEFSDLLKSEQDLLEAQNALATSNGAIYTDIVAFYKATGGGYN